MVALKAALTVASMAALLAAATAAAAMAGVPVVGCLVVAETGVVGTAMAAVARAAVRRGEGEDGWAYPGGCTEGMQAEAAWEVIAEAEESTGGALVAPMAAGAEGRR